ncbi:MAG: hypothetical protein JWO54_485 [Candidatus Saccharibacteria bacterium]|nr:hypothetical protein [Candidatus Saccharibacteria bacterium]MDB5180725.1 hypothetical protein [Candidatus Saccharibacteria bacterium]
MDVSTAITLLTINVIVLSIVIIFIIVVAIILIVKLNKVAKNVQQTTANFAHLSEWLSPAKLFGTLAKTISTFKKR